LATKLAPEGIRFNSVTPGMIDTPMTAEVFANSDTVTKVANGVPMGRTGTPEDLAGPIRFLLSDQANYITGLSLPVDGGTITAVDGLTELHGSGWPAHPPVEDAVPGGNRHRGDSARRTSRNVGDGPVSTRNSRAPSASASDRASGQPDPVVGDGAGASFEDRARIAGDAGAFVVDVDGDATRDSVQAEPNGTSTVGLGVRQEHLDDLTDCAW